MTLLTEPGWPFERRRVCWWNGDSVCRTVYREFLGSMVRSRDSLTKNFFLDLSERNEIVVCETQSSGPPT